MIRPGFITCAAILLGLLAMSSAASASGSRPAVTYIQPDALRQMLYDPDLVIIDVRDPVSWSASALKIPGAVREDPKFVEQWMSKYSDAQTIVLY